MRLLYTCKQCGEKVTIKNQCDTRDELKTELGDKFNLTCQRCDTTNNYICYDVYAGLNRFFFAIAPLLFLSIPLIAFVAISYELYPLFIILPVLGVWYVHYDNREYKRINNFNKGMEIMDNHVFCPIIDDCDINIDWFRNVIITKFEEFQFNYFNDDYAKIQFDGMYSSVGDYLGRVFFLEDGRIILDVINTKTSEPLLAIELEKETECKDKILLFEKFIGILMVCRESQKND